MRGKIKRLNDEEDNKIAILPKKKTTITLALDQNFLNSIKKDAEREGLSINSKMNSVLQGYAFGYRFAETDQSIVIPFRLTQLILDRIEERKLSEYYRSIIRDLIPSKLMQSQIPLTLQNWLRYFSNGIMIYTGAIDSFSNYYDEEGHLCLVYSHSYREKWSRILSNILCEFIQDVLNYHTSYSILSHSIIIKIVEKNANITN